MTRSADARARCLATKGVMRYVVTQLNEFGYRTFAHARQGRHTYATFDEAEAWIKAAHAQNGERLAEFYGLPLEVRACECWPEHFDPMGIIFEPEDK
jgi:hypothetical protein